MGRITVEIMPKLEILDPQGKAIAGALERMGIKGFTSVRQGKRFELTVEGMVTAKHLELAREAAEKLLSNPVIESVVSVNEETHEKRETTRRSSATDRASSASRSTSTDRSSVTDRYKTSDINDDLAKIISANKSNGEK